MTPAELAALPELPAPTFTQREEIIDGPSCFPRCLPILFHGAPLTTLCACMTSMDSPWRLCAWATRRSAGKCAGRPTISRSSALLDRRRGSAHCGELRARSHVRAFLILSCIFFDP